MDVLQKHYLKIDACKFEVIKPLKFDACSLYKKKRTKEKEI